MVNKKYEVYRIFQENPSKAWSSNEVAEKTGLNSREVRVYIYRLKRDGKIHISEKLGKINLYRLGTGDFTDDQELLTTATDRMLNRLGVEERGDFLESIKAELEVTREQLSAYEDAFRETIGLLDFLNTFFKENVAFLSQNKNIMNYVLSNQEKFTAIENILKNGASISE